MSEYDPTAVEDEEVENSDEKLREQGILGDIEKAADVQAAEDVEEDRQTEAMDPADDEPDDPSGIIDVEDDEEEGEEVNL